MGTRIRKVVDDLRRFVDAQERGRPSFADALAELQRGRKTSHWIWYVFPQLRGLGRSPLADHYGLDGMDEARRTSAIPSSDRACWRRPRPLGATSNRPMDP